MIGSSTGFLLGRDGTAPDHAVEASVEDGAQASVFVVGQFPRGDGVEPAEVVDRVGQGQGLHFDRPGHVQPEGQHGRAQPQAAGDERPARGIGADQAGKCLADTANAEKIATMSNEQSVKYDIQGTPTFLINGRKVDYNTWPKLKDELMKLGAR